MCPFFTTLVLLAILAGLIFLFLVWNFGYWKKLGIKEAQNSLLVGSFPSQFTQKRNIAYDLHDIYMKYKKDENFVGVYNSRMPQMLILSPDYAHKVFVNDFKHFHDNEFANFVSDKADNILANNPFVLRGENWKERRAEITPGLTNSRVKSVFPVSQKVSQAFSDYIRSQSKMATKDGLNTKELCLRYTTEVVSDCVLGIKAASFTDNPTPIYGMIKKVFEQSFGFILYAAIANIWPQIRKFYVARFFPKKTEEFFYNLMQTSIDLRRQSNNTDRLDFLNYMLQLQDKKNLKTSELTSHTMTFLTDGFETTATVLAHTLLMLARYPKTQQRLLEEIESKGDITFENLSEMPYLDACLHETLRLFPPQLAARKICTETYELINKNGNKVLIKPEQVAIVPVYSLHHDADIYENPEDFMPERFLEENGGVKKYHDMGVFFGFGGGPRICFGMRFALTQMKSAIVDILKNHTIKLNPKTRQDNELDDTYFMALLKGGIWLDFVPKN